MTLIVSESDEIFFSILSFHNVAYPILQGFDFGFSYFGNLELHNPEKIKLSKGCLEIVLENGEIYDIESHQWVSRIHSNSIDKIVIYPVRTCNPNLITGTICHLGKRIDDIQLLPDLLTENNEILEIDLTTYIYRQLVYEFLWDCQSNRLSNDEKNLKGKSLISNLKKNIYNENTSEFIDLTTPRFQNLDFNYIHSDIFWVELLYEVLKVFA